MAQPFNKKWPPDANDLSSISQIEFSFPIHHLSAYAWTASGDTADLFFVVAVGMGVRACWCYGFTRFFTLMYF